MIKMLNKDGEAFFECTEAEARVVKKKILNKRNNNEQNKKVKIVYFEKNELPFINLKDNKRILCPLMEITNSDSDDINVLISNINKTFLGWIEQFSNYSCDILYVIVAENIHIVEENNIKTAKMLFGIVTVS